MNYLVNMEENKVKADEKDKLGRLKYLEEEKAKQGKRKSVYVQQLEEIQKLLGSNKKEIEYNEGWIRFHGDSIENHKKTIQETFDLNEKIDQEKKLEFHKKQIEEHHNKSIEYHRKEIEFIKREIQIFEDGIKKCEEQLEFLNRKIEENKI